MSFLFPVAIALAAGAPASPSQSALSASSCPEVGSHLARKGGAWRGDGLRPRKLNELPPAETYAAVLRRDERGCMVPVYYRDVKAPRRR